MSKFTLVEVHLDGSDITANAPFSNTGEAESDDETDAPDDEDESGLPLVPIIGLLVVVALAVVARKLLSGETSEEVELDAEAGTEAEVDVA